MKRLSLLGVLALGLTSCVARDYSTSNRSEVILRFASIQGQGTGAVTTVGTVLLSDVLFKGSVINDNAVLTLQTVSKNPLVPALSAVNDVNLTNYSVEYFRSDGRNVEGVDVPYAITGTMATIIPAGNPGPTTSVSIIVVRHQAKDEPPLKSLQASDQMPAVRASSR